MASKLSIISGAAVRLGNDPVIALNEGSKAAVVGNNLYDTVLESLLSTHRWRFATGKISLSLLGSTPLNEWSYAYQLPTNPKIITLIRTTPRVEYQRYENKLYCNTGNGLDIDYVYKPAESQFPAYFVELMEYRMAMEMAIPVTGSNTLRETLAASIVGNGMMAGVMAQARAADSREQPNVSIVDSPFIDVRR